MVSTEPAPARIDRRRASSPADLVAIVTHCGHAGPWIRSGLHDRRSGLVVPARPQPCIPRATPRTAVVAAGRPAGHPRPGGRGAKRGRPHPHLDPRARSRIRWFQKCGSRRPGPDAALRHGLLWWRVDELGLPAGGHPVYAMNGIERGLALSSLLGSYWLPSAPDPGGQRTSRRAGSCSVPARERGPIVCTGFGGPADQSPPPPAQERPQQRRLPHDVQP